jgi:hypothetical protein
MSPVVTRMVVSACRIFSWRERLTAAKRVLAVVIDSISFEAVQVVGQFWLARHPTGTCWEGGRNKFSSLLHTSSQSLNRG